MLPAMSIDEVELLPDPDQQKVLTATLERVNRVSNAVRADRICAQCFLAAYRSASIVREEAEKAKLPDGFVRAITERVQLALKRRSGKQSKFSTFQSLALPATAFKWSPAADRVTFPTAIGPAHDCGASRQEPRRSASAARGAPDCDRVPQRRLRVVGDRRRSQRRRLTSSRSSSSRGRRRGRRATSARRGR